MNEELRTLSRREAIARLALLMGGAVIGAEAFISGERFGGGRAGTGFSVDETALMDEIAETIVPATDTPGAKAAKVGSFMALMVNDCYDDESRAIFRDGLRRIERACKDRHGKSFLEIGPGQRAGLLNDLDGEVRNQRRRASKGEPAHYFHLMKQLAILGYFTSEIGCTQALRYVETPGAYRGDVPCQKGERAWFQLQRPAL